MKILNYIVIVITLILTLSCNKNEPVANSLTAGKVASCSAGESGATEHSLFLLGDKSYQRENLPVALQQQIYENEVEAFNKNQEVIKMYALSLFLSKKSENPPPLDQLVKLPKISESEIKKFFEEKKSQMPPHVTFDQVKDQIVQYLNAQKFSEELAVKVAEMDKSGSFKVMQNPPVSPEFKLDTKDFPSIGNSSSKVKVITISDYLCGHCQMSHPTMKNMIETYKDRVQFIQVNYALRPTGLSGTYARGSYCAQKTGIENFWKYHDETFNVTSVPHDHSKHAHDPAENDGMSKEAETKVFDIVKKIATLNKDFENCLKSKEAIDWVANVGRMMNENGVNGTPTYIVNGKRISAGVNGVEEAIKKDL